MRLTIVIRADLQAKANAAAKQEDTLGGERTFTVPLATPAAPTVPAAYWAGWDFTATGKSIPRVTTFLTAQGFAVWSDDARVDRGAERHPDAIAAEGPQFGDDGELVKGPAPEMWDDPARIERGAELSPEQAAVAPAIPEPWPSDAIDAARPAPVAETE